MTLKTIEIGTYANDGTGDTLRQSFIKINDNFGEVSNTLSDHANTSNVINIAAQRSTNVIFRHANAAFNQANAAYFYAVTVDDNMGYAFLKANLAFQAANGTVINTRAAFAHANAAFNFANNLSFQVNDNVSGLRARTNVIFNFANSIYNHSNAAFSKANLVYNFANSILSRVNVVFSTTNAAFGMANAAYLNSNTAFNRANAAFAYADMLAATKLSNTSGVTFAGSLFFPHGSRIGLGTNAPAGTLHVKNNTDTTLMLLDSDSTQSMSMRFRRNGAVKWNVTNDASTDDLVFSTGLTSNIFRIANEGNVGVGIIPEYKLDINGTANFRSTARFGSFVTATMPGGQINTKGIYSLNPDSVGIMGEATRRVGGFDGSMGVWGKAYDGTGVRGESVSSIGVRGISTSAVGTQGESVSGLGVYGASQTYYGGQFVSTSGHGLYAAGSGPNSYGVVSEALQNGIAVYGKSRVNGYGVYGRSIGGWGTIGHSVNGSSLAALSGPEASPTMQFYVNNAGQTYMNSGFGSAGPAYGCRAWATFSGGSTETVGQSLPIYGAGNISSVVYEGGGVQNKFLSNFGGQGDGYYRVNFATPMPDNNYAITANLQENGSPLYLLLRKIFGNQYIIIANGDKDTIITKNYFRIMTQGGWLWYFGGYVSMIHVAVFR